MNKVLTILLLLNISCTKAQSGYLGRNVSMPNSIIVEAGESNASGSALNDHALPGEIGVRSSVIILNNDNLTLETLNIGVNNITGYGMAYPQYHGWELQIANTVDSGSLPNPVCVVKTAYSGTAIAEWAEGQPHYIEMIARLDTAISVRRAANNGTAPELYMFYSQGINDDATDATVWKNATKAHIASIRALYGRVPYFITYLPAGHTSKNPSITEICAEIADCWPIQTDDLSTSDGLHWTYASMKIIASRMIYTLKAHYTYY